MRREEEEEEGVSDGSGGVGSGGRDGDDGEDSGCFEAYREESMCGEARRGEAWRGMTYLNFRGKGAKVRSNGFLEHEAGQLADIVAKTLRAEASWNGVRRRRGVGA